jgi:hypothetical protein
VGPQRTMAAAPAISRARPDPLSAIQQMMQEGGGPVKLKSRNLEIGTSSVLMRRRLVAAVGNFHCVHSGYTFDTNLYIPLTPTSISGSRHGSRWCPSRRRCA